MTTSILITGANKGIGLGFAKYYLENGANVIATYRDSKNSQALFDLNKVYQQLTIIPLDVTQEKAIEELPKNLAGTKFDIIINNAGASIPQNFTQWTQQSFINSLNINLVGPALISKALSPQINANGKLIQISSGMGSLEWNINPLDDLDAYAASKAALNMLTRRIAEKLKGKNITVIALNPGWVQTDTGGMEAPMNVEEAVLLMSNVINKLSIEDSGHFFSENGDIIPW